MSWVITGSRKGGLVARPPRQKDLDWAGEPRVLLRMLGPFEVCVDGRAIPLKPQTLRLLAVLAVNANQAVSRTTIVDVVWDGEIPEVRNEANQIQVHIKAIRDALASGGLPRDAVEALGAGRYKLRSPPLVTDLGLFRSKVAGAEGLLTAGSLEQASHALTEALALWSGPALDGLSGRLADAEAAGLEEQKLSAVQRRIDVGLWRGRYGEQVVDRWQGRLPIELWLRPTEATLWGHQKPLAAGTIGVRQENRCVSKPARLDRCGELSPSSFKISANSVIHDHPTITRK
jgi:hypothetical protein